MIVLVPENHDKRTNVTPVQHLWMGFDHANLVFALVPFIHQKFIQIRFSNVYFFETEHLKRFISKDDNMFAHERNIGNRAQFSDWQ